MNGDQPTGMVTSLWERVWWSWEVMQHWLLSLIQKANQRGVWQGGPGKTWGCWKTWGFLIGKRKNNLHFTQTGKATEISYTYFYLPGFPLLLCPPLPPPPPPLSAVLLHGGRRHQLKGSGSSGWSHYPEAEWNFWAFPHSHSALASAHPPRGGRGRSGLASGTSGWARWTAAGARGRPQPPRRTQSPPVAASAGSGVLSLSAVSLWGPARSAAGSPSCAPASRWRSPPPPGGTPHAMTATGRSPWMRAGCVLAPHKGLCSSSATSAMEQSSDQCTLRPSAHNNHVLFIVTDTTQFSNKGIILPD